LISDTHTGGNLRRLFDPWLKFKIVVGLFLVHNLSIEAMEIARNHPKFP
jgi:hypothetical protein